MQDRGYLCHFVEFAKNTAIAEFRKAGGFTLSFSIFCAAELSQLAVLQRKRSDHGSSARRLQHANTDPQSVQSVQVKKQVWDNTKTNLLGWKVLKKEKFVEL